jgi:hypothetical protein
MKTIKEWKKEIKNVMPALIGEQLFKYPFGNRELTEKIIRLEELNLIWFDNLYMTWKVKNETR